ncbi:MAG: dTDP-4-dehydrorhamnose reductase, partial [Maribacter arcticus]
MDNKKILILGGSGFIGNAIYKELCKYFDTYGTYCHAANSYSTNNQFVHYNLEEDDIVEVLELVKPQVIISALRGNFSALIIA